MALVNKRTVRNFWRRTYAGVGCLETVTFLKRGDDQQQGTVRAVKVFNARREIIVKSGTSIQHEVSSDHRTAWHLPRVMLDKAGINYVNVLDRIVSKDPRSPAGKAYWEPETNFAITEKLMGEHVCVDCVRVDPPAPDQA